ncbi:MAG: ribulose bisphosphate carboxylase small subunit [Candidatus Limnocylindria bacterium]
MTLPATMRLETFSYLPGLSAEQVAAEVEHILRQGLVPAVEYTLEPGPRSVYWSMWGLPMFEVRSGDKVIAALNACAEANPGAYVKLIGYDPRRQGQVASFVVHRPASEADRG